MPLTDLIGSVARGVVLVPLLWIIGVVLIVGGAISLFRGRILTGIILIIIGILLGGLNVF